MARLREGEHDLARPPGWGPVAPHGARAIGESIFRKQTAGMPSATLFAAISTMKIALSFKLGTLHAILRELAKKNQLSGDELLRRLFP